MKKLVIFCLCMCISPFLATSQSDIPTSLKLVPFDQVKIVDHLWSDRISINHHVSIPHVLDWCEKTGRLRNFAKAAGLEEGDFEGLYFNDSDVYKVIEGAAYALTIQPDHDLEQRIDTIIDNIAAAQQSDGYINTFFILNEDEEKWSNLKDMHELYCGGHLIEAGIAYYNATGKRKLLDVGIRFADLVESLFGPGNRRDVPGHEEIEIALVRLYQQSNKQKYLDLAKFFIDERGKSNGRELYGKYAQDHVLVKDQRKVHGHAVRAMYLFTGVADYAMITGDTSYNDALKSIWTDLVKRKMYITGGIGVEGHGEGFSGEYDLPNLNSYSETCASIALAFYNHRLNLLFADAHYADVMERVIYNGVLAGLSHDGTKFNYRNPLASHGPENFDSSGGKVGDSKYHRQDFFACACCPPNVNRFIPKISEYIYAKDQSGIYVNLFIGNHANINFNDHNVSIQMETNYPWDGTVNMTVHPEKAMDFRLAIRKPAWCDEPEIHVNTRKQTIQLDRGYMIIDRSWRKNDSVTIKFPMPVQRVYAHPYLKANTGRVALQRGPIVYCLEEMDHSAGIWNIALPHDHELIAEFDETLLNGVGIITGHGVVRHVNQWGEELYQFENNYETVDLKAIPYYAWDNRIPGEMVLWLPEHPDLTPLATIANLSQVSYSYKNKNDSFVALYDQSEIKNSADKSIARFTWWNHKGTEEWVQYDFSQVETISVAEVYWFDDSDDDGGCSIPDSWQLLYQINGEWKPVHITGDYPRIADDYNRIEFTPVTTNAVRLKVQLKDGFSAGLLEWQIWQ